MVVRWNIQIAKVGVAPSQKSTTCQDETENYMLDSYLCLIFYYWIMSMTEKVTNLFFYEYRSENNGLYEKIFAEIKILYYSIR